MLLVTALFGGLMLLSIESRRRTIAILLIGCIAILGISPPPAQAQFPSAFHASFRLCSPPSRDDRRLADSRLTSYWEALLALHADGLAACKDQPGEVADPVDHRAVSRGDSVDHVDQPPYRHAASPRLLWRASFAIGVRLTLLPFRRPT